MHEKCRKFRRFNGRLLYFSFTLSMKDEERWKVFLDIYIGNYCLICLPATGMHALQLKLQR